MSIPNYVKDLEFEAFILNECGEVFSGSIHHLAHGLVTVPPMLDCHTTLAPMGCIYLLLILLILQQIFKIVYFESCCVFTIFT